MQITLVQVEIEEAIRQYVNTQINVREGMRIDIDLKATRGAEGYQAFIDIVEDGAPASVKRSPETSSEIDLNTELDRSSSAASLLDRAAVAGPVESSTEETPVTVRRTRGPNKPKADPTISSTSSDPFGSTDDNDTDDQTMSFDKISASAGIDEADEAETAADEALAEADPDSTAVPAEKPRSLFGNLARPTNA